MYIIIVGAGKQGSYLAKILNDEDHDVIVVDKNPEVCDKIANDLDILCINGDATQPEILKKAGIENSDAIVCLTESDEKNMIIGLLGKELGTKQVVAKIEKVHFEESLLKKLGIDIVIHPEAASAVYVAEIVTKPEVLDLAFISRGAAEILEIQAKKGMKIIGQEIEKIEHPENTAIVALYRGNEFVIASPKNKVKIGDKLLILARRDIANKVRKMFA